MSGLEDRTVHTTHPTVKGYVRQTGPANFQWTLKDHSPLEKDEPPFIWAAGEHQTSTGAFQELYTSIRGYDLDILNEG